MRKNKDKYLTCSDAGVLLGLSADRIRHLILEGKIKAEKMGHIWIMTPQAISHITRQRFPKTKEETTHGSL